MHKAVRLLLWLTGLGLLAHAVIPGTAHAAHAFIDPFPISFTEVPTTLAGWIELIFQLIITVSVIVTVILLVIGGIQYLSSAGNEEGTAKARRLILDAIVGLVIVLAAWAIGGFIIDRLTGSSVEELTE